MLGGVGCVFDVIFFAVSLPFLLIIVHFVRRFCMSFRGENTTKCVDTDLIGRSHSLFFLSLLLRKRKKEIYIGTQETSSS